MTVKLDYHPHLYLGEGIKEIKLDKLKKKLEKHPLTANVYLVVLSANPKDQLEFYDAKQLVQRYYQTHTPYVVGIAAGYEDAALLVRNLVQDCLDERGDASLKEYLLC